MKILFQRHKSINYIAGIEYELGISGTWYENVDYCVENGMVLATFGSAEDVEDLYNVCKDAGQDLCWLGLSSLLSFLLNR